MLQLLKENLQQAQARMTLYAYKKRIDKSFEIGDWVYLKLQPYKQTSLAIRKCLKLSPIHYGPYMVICKVGPVAYKL